MEDEAQLKVILNNLFEETISSFAINFMYINEPIGFSKSVMQNISALFCFVIQDHMLDVVIQENLSQEDFDNMAHKCSKDVQKLVKTYTDLTMKLINE